MLQWPLRERGTPESLAAACDRQPLPRPDPRRPPERHRAGRESSRSGADGRRQRAGRRARPARELPQRGLPPLLRGVHRRRGGPDAGRTHQHGAQLASPRPRTVTYDAEGGDRR